MGTCTATNMKISTARRIKDYRIVILRKESNDYRLLLDSDALCTCGTDQHNFVLWSVYISLRSFLFQHLTQMDGRILIAPFERKRRQWNRNQFVLMWENLKRPVTESKNGILRRVLALKLWKFMFCADVQHTVRMYLNTEQPKSLVDHSLHYHSSGIIRYDTIRLQILLKLLTKLMVSKLLLRKVARPKYPIQQMASKMN